MAAVSGALDLEQTLDHILEQVGRVSRCDAVNVTLIEGELACVVRVRGYERFGQDVLGLTVDLSNAPLLRQMQEQCEIVVVPDSASELGWMRLPEVAWMRSCAAVPIRVCERVIGILVLESATPGFFTEADADRLRAFGDQASLALSNAQLFHNVEQAKRDWEGTFDAMQDPIVLLDRGHRIVRANRAFASLVQSTFPQIIGQPYHTVLEGSVCPEPLCPLEEATRNRRAATCVHEQGGRVVEIQATPVSREGFEESTPIAHTIYALRDITGRRRASQEIQRRNRELVLLNRIIAASATSHALDTFLEMVCRGLARTFEVSRSLAILFSDDKTETTIVAGYGVDPEQQGMTTSMEDDPCSQYLLRVKKPMVSEKALSDPRLQPCHHQLERQGTSSLLILPLLVEGEVVGGLRMDTTESRAFTDGELDLAQRVAEQVSSALARIHLEKAQRRLEAAVEQAAEAVVITDTDGTIQYANPALERITGYDCKDTIGRNLPRFMGTAQDPEVPAEMWQTVTAAQTWKGRFTQERQNGSTFSVDVTVSPVRNQVGETVNFVATLRDVTREVELEKQFQEAQKMEALGRLAGGIAHDFNNLLTVIHLSTRFLDRDLDPADARSDHVRNIREASDHAARLTRQLLSFSRREVIEPRMLDLNQVVDDLSQMLQRIIGEDIELVTDLDDDLWAVEADPAQIEQVLMNLVVNARDAMPRGGSLTIETSNVTLDQDYAARHVGARSGAHVLLAVGDTGEGMSSQVKAHLFEPFFTTKEKGRGTGLGLSTVFGIVSRSGGHIRVESQEGEGTRFRVYWPRDGVAETKAHDQVLRTGAGSQERDRETVLVVEDDAGVRSLAARVLLMYGYQVLDAADGPEALRISQQHDGPIHLVLTDVIMPKMNGRDLVDSLRHERPDVAILYMSGYADGVILEPGTLSPDIGFLSKPFSVEGLIEKVRALLDDPT
jgi:PAS domain S-box-containing protein